jgi:hypothetical protein
MRRPSSAAFSDVARIAVLEIRCQVLRDEAENRSVALERAAALALSSTERAVAVAQATADRAVARSELAASKEYLEAQINALREALVQQIQAQKTAIDAALISTKDALVAAQNASDRAIHKSDEAIQKRFDSVNEFRGQLSDQARNFAGKNEVEFRFASIDKMFDTDQQWQRRIELKFSEFATITQLDRRDTELQEWRRKVDASLTAASSKSSLMYAIIAIGIAAGGLMITVYNLISKIPVNR